MVGFEILELRATATVAVIVVELTITTLSKVAEDDPANICTLGLVKFAPRIVMSTLVPTTTDDGLILVITGLGRITVNFAVLLVPAVVLTLTGRSPRAALADIAKVAVACC